MKLTIQHIAAHSGVSKGTVSRVINGHSTVAASTRVRVQAVMEELGYVPDPAARELSMRSHHSVGLSLAQGDRRLAPYFVLFQQALERRFQELGIQLVQLSDHLEEYKRLPSALLVLGAKENDPRVDFVMEKGLPSVLIGHHQALSWVAPDDENGGYLATKHLLELGHRQIAHLGGRVGQQGGQDRHMGFDRALREHALEGVISLEGNYTTLEGYRAVRRAWESGLRFSALFAESDEMAVGAIAALEDLGVVVPDQVSVIGFDGLPEQPYTLTTIAQDIPAIAQQTVELLLEALEGLPARHILTPVKLILGQTTTKFVEPPTTPFITLV